MKGFSGSKRDFSINCNFYPRRFVLDVSYQKTWIASGSVTYNGETVDVEADWLVTKMLNIDAYYTFNYRKFSYDSPFTSSMCRRSQQAPGWQACRIRAAVSDLRKMSPPIYRQCT